MGLLDAYKKATNNWDAKDGKLNESQLIPEGDYEVMLGKVDHPVYQSGWDCLRFDMQVIAGKFASRHEQLRISLATKTSKGKPMPEFVVSRNIRTIAKIGEMVGLEMKPEYFPDNETDAYEKLVAAFKPYEGKTLHMTIKETPTILTGTTNLVLVKKLKSHNQVMTPQAPPQRSMTTIYRSSYEKFS